MATDGDPAGGTTDEGAEGDEVGEPTGWSGYGRFWLARALSGIAWAIGLALIVIGLLAITGSRAAGLFYLLPGLLITPRTRRELQALCAIVCGAE